MITFSVIFLPFAAFVIGMTAIFVVGTIVVTNFTGNYETAGKRVFWVGLTAMIGALGLSILYGAVVITSLWILALSGFALLGWVLMIVRAR